MSTNETPAKAATPRNPFHAEMIVHVREIDGSVYLSSGNVCGLYTAFDIFCTEDEARYIAHAVNHAAQLETELAQTKAELARVRELSDNQASALKWAQEKLAECRKDGARLDWLEQHHHWILCAESESPTFSCGRNDNFQNWALKVATVRAAIDAAMKGADK